MSWFKRLLGKKDAEIKSQEQLSQNDLYDASSIISEEDPRIHSGHDQVLAYWQEIGSVDDDVVSYIVNPMFLGAPAWPNTRQAYRIVRTSDSLIITSDGLSDPFVETDRNNASGFGLEVYIEVSNAQDWSFDQISKSAEFELIEMVAQNAAGHGGITELLDDVGVLSMMVPLTRGFPKGWQDSDGQVGVLIGMPVPGRKKQIELPFGPCRFVAVTPILPAEIEAVAASSQARNQIAEKLSESSSEWRFDVERI